MDSILAALSSASGISIGVIVAACLIAAISLLTPASERRILRQPVGFFLAHLVLRGVEQLLSEGTTVRRWAFLLALLMLLLSIGRGTVLLMLDILLHRRLGRPLPKIIRDIIQGVVYFVLLLALLQQMGLEPGQLLTTSALLTAVIGLSLQETLGNLIAGLSVQVQRPFSVGDWIQFDTDKSNIGRVIEINWRATTLITLDEIQVVVPNGMLAKAPLRVFTQPTKAVRRNIFVLAEYAVPPKRAHQIILEAVRDVPGVLAEPAPNVVTNAFGDSGIEYWVRIYIDQFNKRDGIDGAVRDRIWYAFNRASIEFPFPHRVVHMQEHSEETRAKAEEKIVAKRAKALERVDFLKVISDEQRLTLARRAKARLFSAGEVIVKQGEATTDFFIIQRGEVVIVLSTDQGDKEITRLEAPKFFGEMALVTGEPRKASVKAARECELLVIDHAALQPVFEEAPEVVEALSKVLAKRQLELDVAVQRMSEEERESVVQRESSQLLSKIKRLFAIK